MKEALIVAPREGNWPEFRSVSLLRDGEYDRCGRTLNENYNTYEKVQRLMDLGSLIVLGEEIGLTHSLKDPNPKWCISYKRDFGGAVNADAAWVHYSLGHAFHRAWRESCKRMYQYLPSTQTWRMYSQEQILRRKLLSMGWIKGSGGCDTLKNAPTPRY